MQTWQPLHDRLVTLAGTPDDDPGIGADLTAIAQLAADRVAAVEYASMTANGPDGYVTVAASSDLAAAVDRAQYADDAGPCLDALDSGRPAVVSEISATMQWPGFRVAASRLGLNASVSIPLFAGRGVPMAALNLYGRHPDTMRALSTAVRWAYGVDDTPDGGRSELDAGGSELVAGLIGAFAVQAVLQQAIGVVIALTGSDADDAYATLCRRAIDHDIGLTDAASHIISGQRW